MAIPNVSMRHSPMLGPMSNVYLIQLVGREACRGLWKRCAAIGSSDSGMWYAESTSARLFCLLRRCHSDLHTMSEFSSSVDSSFVLVGTDQSQVSPLFRQPIVTSSGSTPSSPSASSPVSPSSGSGSPALRSLTISIISSFCPIFTSRSSRSFFSASSKRLTLTTCWTKMITSTSENDSRKKKLAHVQHLDRLAVRWRWLNIVKS